jgi:hypothetical protein
MWQVAETCLPEADGSPVPTALKKAPADGTSKNRRDLLAVLLEAADNIADYARRLEAKLYYLQQHLTEQVAKEGAARDELASLDRRLRIAEEKLALKEKERQQLWLKLVRLRDLVKRHGIDEQSPLTPMPASSPVGFMDRPFGPAPKVQPAVPAE